METQSQDGEKRRGSSEPPGADEKVQGRATSYPTEPKIKRWSLTRDAGAYNSKIKQWSRTRIARVEAQRKANSWSSKTSTFTVDATGTLVHTSELRDLRVAAGQVSGFLFGLPRF